MKRLNNAWVLKKPHRFIQGPPCLSVQSKLALTDRNMHAKKIWKMVLKSWDYEFVCTATHFYEMLTVLHLLGPMWVTLSFKNKFSIFVQFLSKFCLFFLLIVSLDDSINARNDSWLHRTKILIGFDAILQVFATTMKSELLSFFQLFSRE
jgi:hypothetical protein